MIDPIYSSENIDIDLSKIIAILPFIWDVNIDTSTGSVICKIPILLSTNVPIEIPFYATKHIHSEVISLIKQMSYGVTVGEVLIDTEFMNKCTTERTSLISAWKGYKNQLSPSKYKLLNNGYIEDVHDERAVSGRFKTIYVTHEEYIENSSEYPNPPTN